MLQITIPARSDVWDEEKEEFLTIPERRLQLEHSLVSVSKWESRWHRPFLSKEPHTPEQELDYVKCMTLTQNVPPETYFFLTKENLKEIRGYIDDPMTATVLPKQTQSGYREQITSELIYFWMISQNIPSEYKKWHLNRLLTLINLCFLKNAPPKKLSQREMIEQRNALNEKRKRALHSRG